MSELARLREESARLIAEREQLEALQGQFHVEVRAYQEGATRFQEEVQSWREVQQREQDALEKDRRDFQDVIARAQAGFEETVSHAVEARAQEMVVAIGRDEVLRQMGEVIRAEERDKADAALRAEYDARWQALQLANQQAAAGQDSASKPSRFSRKSLGKRALEELPRCVFIIRSVTRRGSGSLMHPRSNIMAVARRFNAGDADTPSRVPLPHGGHAPPSVKQTPVGSSRAASRSLTDLSLSKKKIPTSSSASSVEAPNPEAGSAGTHALGDQLARIAYCTTEGVESPSVSAAKKMARRMTTSSAIVRPPLPTHANSAPTTIPIWNPDSLPPPPVYDMDDEENLPSPFLKKLSTKSRTSTGPLSQAKRGMLAMAAANAAALEPKPPMTGKEQQAPSAAMAGSTTASNVVKGPRLSMARAIKVGEEARQKLARRAL
ncbi:hypothetical protein CALCODRAFT_305161 [Calocera cornea HHB12733]|uniref:Uncharacterized protein n=1 Tax=Calocera cornea HHB12733 TaxID=1353952 RepID=A0A165JLL3_9BASI|nr:hypothetical protein CALCODRAFT_305161 [Calocera cornea HHB12733]